MKNSKIYMMLAAMVLCSTVRAQYDETNNLFYHTQRTPQSTLYNPAFFPTNTTFYLSLPGTEIQMGGPLSLSEFMYYDKAQGRTIINLDSMFNQLSNDNRFRLGANVELLGFGIKLKKTFVTFNMQLVNSLSAGFPISTINALRIGNIDASGTPIAEVEMFRGDLVNVQSYLETALGVGYTFEPIHLTVGARAKLLYGIANIQSDKTHVTLETDAAMNDMTARMYYEIQSATFVPYDTIKKQFDFSNIGDILNPMKANTGLAFDLGAKYDWGPFTFSLALNDLSAGIHWKNNVTTWRPENGQGYIEFSGMDINALLNNGTLNSDSLSQYLQNRLDGMKPVKTDSGDYWFAIPTKINLGASYNFAKMLRAGILFHGQFDRGLLCKRNDGDGDVENTFRFNTTLSLGANLYNWAEVVIGSSIIYDGKSMDFFNPGLGIILTPFTVMQVYLMTDYVSSFYLTEAKAFNIKVGLNLLFGTGGRDFQTAN